MSAYIVEDRVVNAIVSFIRNKIADGGLHYLEGKLRNEGYDVKAQGYEGLAQAIANLNDSAIRARYSEETLAEMRPRSFQYKEINGKLSAVRVSKALHCLLYQCSEGDVICTPLFKLLEELSQDIHEEIVMSLPAYGRAKWGY